MAKAYQRLGDAENSAYWYRKALAQEPDNVPWGLELQRIEEMLAEGQATPERVARRSRGAAWYDRIYSQSEQYSKPSDQSVYAPAWDFVTQVIKNERPVSILEIGCGSGQLARMVMEAIDDVQYCGFDFSDEAIRCAREMCPAGEFWVGDALDRTQYGGRRFDLAIATEFLEHVEDDLAVLSYLPRGVRIIATVPDFDSLAHVRYFRSEADVHKHYARAISDINCEPISVGSGHLFVITGTIG